MNQLDSLSEQEFQLIQNAEILRVKNAALQKIFAAFRDLQVELKNVLSDSLFTSANFGEQSSSKISRGENYLGLPYMVLDYPASFSKESIFAFRSFFWWGNFFSFTLHLQGDALESRRSILLANTAYLKDSEFSICINDSPWEYHFETANFKKCVHCSELELQELFKNKSFIKISIQLPIKEHKQLNSVGKDTLIKLLKLTEKSI